MTIPSADPSRTRIGWIGTGVMGAAMCSHLLKAGYTCTVFNRTRQKAEGLLAAGARWADSPKEVAERSDIVFTIVGYPQDVREVILGPQGVLQGLAPGGIVVDMTTNEPKLAIEIHEAARSKDCHALDAPVSGGDVGAREGRLSIMIGGHPEVVEAVMPCFHLMGKTIVHHGGPGAGQHAKMTNQILIASTMVGVCEGLLYAYRAGLDLNKVIESVASGAAGSWSISNLGPRIIQNRFEPGFYVEHLIKDLGIAIQEAKRMGLVLPGLALAEQLYLAVAACGHARSGTHALQIALARISNIDWLNRPPTWASTSTE
ncbi:NAD(P)-dependent oxidoreductase [Thermogutta sp.]|uniref:NAD(P)-dependent oxidoreductase n=1 Tax=Thermogutta sp. TaxID=1962930 RepID=UPI003C7E066A